MGWFIRKLKGGIQCLKENGLGYTVHHFWNKYTKKLSKIGAKILEKINKLFRKISSALNLGFIEIIKVKTYIKDKRYGRVYFVFLFGKQIYPTKHQHQTNAWVDPNQPVMYFKINRMSDYAKPCIQHWVNIAYYMKADYYFVCDNKSLEYYILRTVNFPGADIKFIPSIRKEIRTVCKNIATSRWENATYAHLTPFYHARKIGAKKFWAIDADDTMICLKHCRSAQVLNTVQDSAEKNNDAVTSLDMWSSRTLGRHWSWGVAFVNNTIDFIHIFTENQDQNWITFYRKINIDSYNLDWFFTYLRDYKKIRIKTFYVENLYFIHWGSILRSPIFSGIFFWQTEKLIFPVLNNIFLYKQAGIIDVIAEQKVTLGDKITQQEGLEFLQCEVSTIKWLPSKLRDLYGIDFSTHTVENL